MNSFTLPCTYCQNPLSKSGSLLETDIGPFVCCNICRALYFVDVVQQNGSRPVIVINPTHFGQEKEYEIIRFSTKMTPLSEFFAKSDVENTVDINQVIKDSKTPTDFIKKLNDGKML